jgi:hypothetical protein
MSREAATSPLLQQLRYPRTSFFARTVSRAVLQDGGPRRQGLFATYTCYMVSLLARCFPLHDI